eukprot:TRINITY_DN572_c0_g7_i1.p1 TRINITY_DN572_c0_g7~~TRINITY_DN572_c0_g7_i1.p1  ORF type:complete len:586 (+),score=250.04 TRINITY_DN572_c0_g7_i1:69-1826(+)
MLSKITSSTLKTSQRVFGANFGLFSKKKDMHCYQCEQARDGTACTTSRGVCGKDASVAALQDGLIHVLKGVGKVAVAAKKDNVDLPDLHEYTTSALFSTVTNVNFSKDRMQAFIEEGVEKREELKQLYKEKTGKDLAIEDDEFTTFSPKKKQKDLIKQTMALGILERQKLEDPNILSVKELITYGLKGMAAYLDHALEMHDRDDEVAEFIYDCMAKLGDKDISLDDLLALAMKTGEVNFRVMEMLSDGHCDKMGTPEPSVVQLTARKSPKGAILVSGHDMPDLLELLKRTEGTGVDVYTHGEMLPAHGYPELKKFDHLVGNYGSAWQKQKTEFEAFPGPVLLTTNCLMPPKKSYKDRTFTMHAVGFDNVKHVNDWKDYEEVINMAIDMGGFKEDEPEHTTMTGFGHDAVLGIADTVVGAVKEGKLKRFVLIGGCDGHEDPERGYYHDLAHQLPKDNIILTLGCGKYRFNKDFHDFGELAGVGLPRMLDMGQCNDSFSAIKVALALADVFECGVNDLPLNIVLSWFEQKAVAVLLTLLHLDVKNIMIGPKLPAFVTPDVLNVLVENWGLSPTGTVEDDLKKIAGEQ